MKPATDTGEGVQADIKKKATRKVSIPILDLEMERSGEIAECEAEYYCVQSHCDTVINSNLFSKHVNRASGYDMCC